MSLHEQQARFRRLLFEHAAWRLLHAENAPIILAFINDLFAQDSEVPFGKARVALEAELPIWQEVYGLHDNAGTYLRQWIQAGWLRELDDKLTEPMPSSWHCALLRAWISETVIPRPPICVLCKTPYEIWLSP